MRVFNPRLAGDLATKCGGGSVAGLVEVVHDVAAEKNREIVSRYRTDLEAGRGYRPQQCTKPCPDSPRLLLLQMVHS